MRRRSDLRPASQADRRHGDRSTLASLGWAALPVLAVLIADFAFSRGFAIEPFTAAAFAIDGLLTFYLALCLLAVQRRGWLGALLGVVLLGGVVAAAWVKVGVLGTPPRYKDLGLVWDALLVASPPMRYATLAALGVVLALLAWNARPPPAGTGTRFLPLAAYALVLGLKAWAPAWGAAIPTNLPTYWYQGYQMLGHQLLMFAEPLSHFDRRETLRRAAVEPPPDVPTPIDAAAIPPLAPRNIHVVVVESLFDVTQLKTYHFSDDPLMPLFRRWRDLPRTTALSPVFGGKSSNPEFEVLCGLPATIDEGQVLFWDLAKPGLPCLPNLLRARGWTTSTFVPAVASFFNAAGAYRAIGFDRHVSLEAMEAGDLDGEWLSADATVRQNLAHAQALRAAGKPALNYLFIVASHFPYVLDQAKRPLAIRVTPGDALLERYVNALRYNMLAVEAMVDALRREDPEALVLVLGDHAPPLGFNFAAYRQGGLLSGGASAETTAPALYETPLLVIDRGELLALGRVPQYLLPEIVLDRLSDGIYCRDNRCGHRQDRVLRPFAASALVLDREGAGFRSCPLDGPVPADCTAPVRQSRYLQKKVFDLLE